MIILHTGMYRNEPTLWAETDEISTRKKSSRIISTPYELSADSTQLKNVLKPIGITHKTLQYPVIALPTKKDSVPVPSNNIMSDVLSKTSKEAGMPVLKLWSVTAVTFDSQNIVKLFAHVIGKRILNPGVLVGADMAYMADAMHLAGSMVARQQYLPDIDQHHDDYMATWKPIITGADSKSFEGLLHRMPGSVLAFDYDDDQTERDMPTKKLLNMITMFAGILIRTSIQEHRPAPLRHPKKFDSVHDSWMYGLQSYRPGRMARNDAVEVLSQLRQWQHPITITTETPLRLCFRLEEPENPKGKWFVRYLLQSRDDPSLLVPAEDAWNSKQNIFSKHVNIKEFLLMSLGQASGIFPHIAAQQKEKDSKSGIRGCFMDIDAAYGFLTRDAAALRQAGYGVMFPSWWTGAGTKAKIRARADIKMPSMRSSGTFNLASIISFDWQVAVGNKSITLKDLQKLADAKTPLISIRGEWIEMSNDGIQKAITFLKKSTKNTSMLDVIKLRLGNLGISGRATQADDISKILDIKVTGQDAKTSQLLEGFDDKALLDRMEQPEGFEGTLRPYQIDGFSWMWFLQKWGLGCCLADDMGLGKTIQMLALIQQYTQQTPARRRSPFLLVCPTSVISNWHQESSKFAPELSIMIHHGGDRIKTITAFKKAAGRHDVVITSYGLLQKDADILKKVQWEGMILDEAQNIKNPHSKQAQSARSVTSRCRFALTGTPVENNVGDLWSMMEFLNPGFLGSQADFKRNFFLPIQTKKDKDAAEQLRQATGPFILRRLKTDKTIITDLPEKTETKTYCSLTKEQASLYAAVLKDMSNAIYESEGIKRRGMILGALTKLKQVCDHPAVLLKDNSEIMISKKDILRARSGKLTRLTEILSEITDAGDSALVFTQFVEMGHILRRHIQEMLGYEVLFLHGGTSRKQRDKMVQQFQDQKANPKIFVISLKAGGTGLNLTAASHVIHFDRWWNPAVEDQATDRAFRIGQKKNVQVHKMICPGTLEEKIDDIIEAKKSISRKVVGTGENWITEMSNEDLREVLALSAKSAMMEDEK